MEEVKPRTSVAVLIGDIVDSRATRSRRALHDEVSHALACANGEIPSLTPLAVTVGDEFQGSYATLGAAIDAALRLRLFLLPHIDVRVGIGRGLIETLDAARGITDGPGWWAAREAITFAEAQADLPGHRSLRTAYRSADGDDRADAINSALRCRDHVVSLLDERALRLLRGLMIDHATQTELAAAEGISASAVSQRVRRDGLAVLLESSALLAGMP